MRGLIWFTLVIFSKFTTLSRNNGPWRKIVSGTPSPTPHTIRYSQKRPLWPFSCPLIPWLFQTQSPNQRWLDRSKMTLRRLVLPWTNGYYHLKVCWPSTSPITTSTTTSVPISSYPTNNSTNKLGSRTTTKSSSSPDWRVRWRKLCRGWLNLDGG